MATPREVKVGAFVLAGLLVTGLVIFMIGDERGLFKPQESYQVVFDDVQGLKRGSPVRMGGVDVGTVSDVAYSDKAADPRLYVKIEVTEAQGRRIREDSVATIDNKGLLGDKMITITIGSADKAVIPPGGTIKSDSSKDLSEMLAKVSSIGEKADRVMGNLEKTTGAFADEKFTTDLKSSISSLNNILKNVDQGDGYASRLLRDPKEADRLSRTLANLEKTSNELNQTMRGVNAIIGRVNQGPGFAHEVIYGEGPQKTLNQFGGAADELALTLKGIREGNGPAKSLLYGDDNSQEVMGNLNAMSRDLRQIVANVKAGKGTVGALLVDPSVYEDVKMLLGNVQRNKTLRALVRYSIKRDERTMGVEVKDPKPAPVPAPASTSGDSETAQSP